MWIIQNWRLLAGGAILIGVFVFGFVTGASRVQAQWDSESLELEHDRLEKAEQDRKKIQELEIQHDKDEQTIRNFSTAHPGGVRVPKAPRCRPSDTVGSVQTPAGSEPLSVGVEQAGGNDKLEDANALTQESYESAVQTAFDELDSKAKALTLEADLIVNDCRVMSDYLKSVK
ncbi:hypothetical protein [Caudoviricetes sp.]|nr:hypothetical protein [Caudoviricetes sp.]